MYSLSWKPRIWRSGGFAECLVAGLLTAMLSAGCSSSSNSNVSPSAFAGKGPAADPQVNAALANSCADCHSDRRGGPWNSKLAPSYLFGANKARDDLNLSDWASLDRKQRRAAAEAIATEVGDGAMPPGDYELLHPSARLNAEQKRLVLQWSAEQAALPAH